MNLEKLNQWLALTTNIAVVLGIILVAYELNQNEASLRAETASANVAIGEAGTALMQNLWLGIAADEELTDIWIAGNSRTLADATDQTRYDLLANSYIRNLLLIYSNWERMLGEGGGSFLFPVMRRDLGDNPGLRDAARRFLEVQPGGSFSEELRNIVNSYE